MENKQIKKIHFVGIKGVGMASLAIIAKEAGVEVSGSDVAEQFITDISLFNAGITPSVGFAAENVNNAQMVVTTGAHGGYDNPEVKSAKEKGIRVVSMAEATGLFMDGEIFGKKQIGISVSGTHGKTTTTAMIATILKENDLDPSYLVGTSQIPSLENSGHYGKGEYFVAEADEYATEPIYDRRPKFIWHNPKIVVITNIEHDHPDIYPDLESIQLVFQTFLQNLPDESIVIANGDDPVIKKVLPFHKGKSVIFGKTTNDFQIYDIKTGFSETSFKVRNHNSEIGEFKLNVAGEHNCLNALAAILVGLEIGLSIEQIKNGLLKFIGTKRRLEFRGKLPSGALLYDDYGHHPTEIKKTLEALRAMHPHKKIHTIFQPHTYSRTKALFADFANAFSDSDSVTFLDIFASARESEDTTVSSENLANEAKKVHPDAKFLPKIGDVVKYLNENKLYSNSVVITMGAGDVYKIGDHLLK